MSSGVRKFIEIGCTKCNCKLTLLCICTDRRQMMGTNGIKGVWRSFKQGIHSKNASFKSYGVIYICNIVNSVICLLLQLSRSRRFSDVGCFCDIFTNANSKLSSTRNTSQCKKQQDTFSFKSVFLHFLYTPALHVLHNHA